MDKKSRVVVNPHYTSRLLGPLALAAEMDAEGLVLGAVDYTNRRHCELVIENLVRPTFERLDVSDATEVKNSLGYLSTDPNARKSLIEDRLLLCGIPPEEHCKFITLLWAVLFGEDGDAESGFEQFKVVNKPLGRHRFSLIGPQKRTLAEPLDELRIQLALLERQN
ncbi:hypothetical protein [Pseudomonas sp. USHLN015]|uniref:hypothetical protein n=1 Tax=Pseudomonas sp. USHLN015 TaxID=3081296 RepID=UPI00301C8B75